MTDKPKWTPGPWKAEKWFWQSGGKLDKSMSFFLIKPDYPRFNGEGQQFKDFSLAKVELIHWGEDLCEANAHLIAAAPELYEALEAIRQYMILNWTDETGKLLKGMADKALAKARGEGKEG